MADKKRCLMIGAGGMAGRWLRDIRAPFRDRMEFAALVDVDAAVLGEAADWLGLPASARFTGRSKHLSVQDGRERLGLSGGDIWEIGEGIREARPAVCRRTRELSTSR